ncbi:hypothetical protein FI667_g2912, partial [Globisporangium splendens]
MHISAFDHACVHFEKQVIVTPMTVEVFECEGVLSAVDVRLRLTLRAYADGSLSVQAVQVNAEDDADQSAADAEGEPEGDGLDCQTHDLHMRHAMQRNGGDANEEAERVADDQPPDAAHDDAIIGADEEVIEEEEAMPGDQEFLAFDGRCVKQFDPERNNAHYFIVHFKLVLWSRSTFSSQVVQCAGNLSSEHGFVGKCVPMDAEGELLRFHIPFVRDSSRSHRMEPLDHQLYPLTPGIYELAGYTIAENGYVYRCSVHLELHPDGLLTGFSQELLFPQQCAIKGTWSREELSYSMRYAMEDRVCTYEYYGSPFLGDLRGSWRNTDDDVQHLNAERGFLSFDLCATQRRWSEAVHKEYPAAFQQCILTVLMASRRAEDKGLASNYKEAHIPVRQFATFNNTKKQRSDRMARTKKPRVVTRQEDADSRSNSAAEAFCCEYEGTIGGFLSGSTVFVLRVRNDATLEGHVLQSRADAVATSPLNAGTSKRRKLTTTTRTTRMSGAQEAVACDYSERVVCARIEGKARSMGGESLAPNEPLRYGDEYCCYFDISPELEGDGDDNGDDEKRAIACHVHFSPSSGSLLGFWAFHHEKPFWITAETSCELYNQELTQRFELQRVHKDGFPIKNEPGVNIELKQVKTEEQDTKMVPQASKLYPLTPGLYEFRGFTTTAPLPRPTSASSISPGRRRRGQPRTTPLVIQKDECFVTLQLLPDGTIKGTSRELLHPQSCPVHGTWRIDRIRYTLEYKVRDAVGLFRYWGRIEGASKIHGKWRNVDEGHQEGYDGGKGEFELELTQAVRHNVLKRKDHGTVAIIIDDENVNTTLHNKIRVLTTGTYRLKGCATDDDGYEYGCELNVQLLPSGYLRGTSRELVFDQTRPVFGLWSPKNLSFHQSYVVKGDVGNYYYSGTIDDDGGVISGEWENAEEEDKESRGEKGTFAYGIVDAQRLWTPYSHHCYPKSFRDGVLLVLLCSSRTHALLSCSLWPRVFEFCHETWFVVAK